MVSFEIISALAFFGIVAALIFWDRKNFEFQYVLIIRRWKHGTEIIDKFISKRKKILSKLGEVSVVLGFVGGLVGLAILLYFSIHLQRAFGLALPTVGNFQYPGPVVSIPFWYWFIGIFIIVATHESMHAVYARMERIPLKSYGLFLFLLLPIGAFVDPDTDKIKRLPTLPKLKIFSAGGFINMVTALLVIFLSAVSSLVVNHLTQSEGVNFKSTIPGTAAANADLSGTITAVNGHQIKSLDDLAAVFEKIKQRH